ncbi:MAG TPA: thiamine phosphate synthase [Patescibacteria group bacterium]|nr:thiamine phosphate synthase [Patescibacteria group bacterium]
MKKAGKQKDESRPMLPNGLYCLTGMDFSRGRSNREVVEKMLEAGVRVIQYREKELPSGQKYRECLEIREMTRRAGALMIVNDDIAIAILVAADGVHIGQDDLPLEQVRHLVGPHMLIGLSTHSRQQAIDAANRGADYIGVGPVFATATKADAAAAIGLEGLKDIAAAVNIPVVAIGGIKEQNVVEVLRNGADCAAIISDIVGADDIVAKVRDIQKNILKETK